jgi:hypothetical protein
MPRTTPDRTAQPSQIGGTGWPRRALWVVQTHTGPAADCAALQIREWEPKEVWISEERLGVQLVNMADNKTLVRRRIPIATGGCRESSESSEPGAGAVAGSGRGDARARCAAAHFRLLLVELPCLVWFAAGLPELEPANLPWRSAAQSE